MFVTSRSRPFLLLLLTLILVSCSPATPGIPEPLVEREPVADRYTGPGRLADPIQPPLPTATPAEVLGLHPPQPSAIPEPSISTILSSTTVAASLSPGWTRYVSINQIHDLAFSPQGTLWASTSGGLVHWDLTAGNYTRYEIQAGRIALDPSGALWLAMQEGLCRLDGNRCTPFFSLDELEARAILALAVTQEGVVWIGTTNGVSRFDGQTWKRYPSPASTNDLAVAASGEVWAATSGGVGRYLPDQDSWLTYTQSDGLSNTQAQAVATGPQGDVWVSLLWEGMVRFDGERWQKVGEPPGGLVGELAVGSDGTPWIGTVGSLHYPGGTVSYFDGETWIDVGRAAVDPAGQSLRSIRAIALGEGGVVAAATNLGLGIYQGDQWHLLRDGPMSDQVTTVAVTPDGAAWFGFGDTSLSTPGGGLSRFDGLEWEYHLEDAEVNTLAVAPDGTLWAGVGCSIQRFDGSTWQTVARCEQDLALGNVLDLEFTGDGTAWAATGMGLAHYDGRSWTDYDKLANSLAAAPDGAVWISGWQGLAGSAYVARFDPATTGQAWTTYPISESFPGEFILQAVTPDGLVWGTVPDRGLASYDGGDWTAARSWSMYTAAGSLALNAGLDVAVAPDGTLWVHTPQGLAQLDPERGTAQGKEGTPAIAWIEYALEGDSSARILGPIAFGIGEEIWSGATRFQPLGLDDE